MRNQVLKFLSELPAAPETQFNEALLWYMKSPVPNPGLVRSYNQQGYSVQRLSELLYDLKKAFDIKDSDITVVMPVASAAPTITLHPNFPEFSKGPKGNQERKAYLAQHNISSDSFKNDDMDAAILAHLKKEEGNKIMTAAASQMQVDAIDESLVAEVKAVIEAKNVISEALDEKIKASNEETKTVIDTLLAEATDALIKERFERVMVLTTSGETIPLSLIKEIYEDAEMSDENAQVIINEAKALVDASSEGQNISENDTDVSKNDTLKSDTETFIPESEKK